MKKGRLSKEEKEYIISNRRQPIEQLAKTLDRSVESINSVLNGLSTVTKTIDEKKKNTLLDLMPKKKGAIAMSEAMSHHTDDIKPKKRFDPSIIFKPLGDK